MPLYDLARQAFAAGDIDWDANDIRVILVNATGSGTLYTVNLAAHQFLSSVNAGARVATSGALTGKTNVAGVLDADDITFSTLAGDLFEAVIIYQHTGVEATSRLIAYIDSGAGLPFTPNGADALLSWDNGSNKILKI